MAARKQREQEKGLQGRWTLPESCSCIHGEVKVRLRRCGRYGSEGIETQWVCRSGHEGLKHNRLEDENSVGPCKTRTGDVGKWKLVSGAHQRRQEGRNPQPNATVSDAWGKSRAKRRLGCACVYALIEHLCFFSSEEGSLLLLFGLYSLFSGHKPILVKSRICG